MTLSIMDRLIILGLLPEQGDILTLRMRQEMVQKVGLTDKEIEEWEVVQNAQGIHWNVQKVQPKEINFSRAERSLIAKKLKELDEQKQLKPDHLPIYDLFVK